MSEGYDPAQDPVHGSGWNSAARWGGWDWREPRGAQHYRTCSFCGSISPQDLAAEPAGTGCGFPGCPEPHSELSNVHFPGPEAYWNTELQTSAGHPFLNTGWRASWADQKYGWPHKFYVKGLVNRHPEIKRIVTALSEDQYQAMLAGKDWPVRQDAYEWHRASDIPDGYDASGWRLEDGRYAWVGFGSDKTHHAKFYSVHLADPAIGDEVRETVSRVCGLRFTFTGGKVSWKAYAPPEEPAAE